VIHALAQNRRRSPPNGRSGRDDHRFSSQLHEYSSLSDENRRSREDVVMSADGFASLPEPPYWAVVLSSRRRAGSGADPDAEAGAYAAAAERVVELAAGYPGYLGIESTRDAAGFGINVSYWASEEAIRAWRDDAEHTLTRGAGRVRWYDHYELRMARVERAYGWDVIG
jgi:heme-degrading monooxygenase HmoA